MPTRTEMVFKAAKTMYAAVASIDDRLVGGEKPTEAELWKDADEYTRQEYTHLAYIAWQSFMDSLQEMNTISVGGCRCADNGLHRPDKIRDSDRTCNTCGGRCR